MNISGFYFITDSALTRKGVLNDVKDAIAGGAAVVQYREKGKGADEMIKEALVIKKACKGKALFLINDRADVALAAGADGVHVGQDDISYKRARKLLGKDKIIGVTVHDVREAKKAERRGADYVGASPIFATKTKSDAGEPMGLKKLAEIRKAVKVPIAAIGGITLDNAKEAVWAGADSLCAISATVGARDVKGAVKRFDGIIKRSKAPRIVAGAIIESGGKLLITRRGKGHAKGLWEFPGGKVEYGETVEAGLKREIREELCCTIRVGPVAEISYFASSRGEQFIMVFYKCKIIRGKPALTEHEEMAWVAPKELKRYKFTKADAAIIKKLLK